MKEARQGSSVSSLFPKALSKSFKQTEVFTPCHISYQVGYAAYIVTLSFHSFLRYT